MVLNKIIFLANVGEGFENLSRTLESLAPVLPLVSNIYPVFLFFTSKFIPILYSKIIELVLFIKINRDITLD